MAFVYCMEHTSTGKVYIGSSRSSLGGRFSNHIWKLREGYHYCKAMQELWNGDITEWSYRILEDDINPDDVGSRERQHYLKYEDRALNQEKPKDRRVHMYETLNTDVENGMVYRDVAKKHGVALGTVTNAVRWGREQKLK